jgi:hypothetical protein
MWLVRNELHWNGKSAPLKSIILIDLTPTTDKGIKEMKYVHVILSQFKRRIVRVWSAFLVFMKVALSKT